MNCKNCGSEIRPMAWTIPGLCMSCRDEETWKDEPEEKKKAPSHIKIINKLDWGLNKDRAY